MDEDEPEAELEETEPDDEERPEDELDEDDVEDEDKLPDDDALLMELDETELDGGTVEEEPLLELGGADADEALEEDALDALAELEPGGGCVPMCVRCGLRLLRGCRRSCRFRSGLRSAKANAFFLRRFIESQPSAFSFQ
ncbi:MAG: hypothetical protein NT105_09230 [Verrucomicrobia bacterium]|nr:hypothetical protein [Verrucomicrobiota bacterium]